MKKLLTSSIVLFLFSASILMFQVACDKDTMASSLEDENQKIIYLGDLPDGSEELHVANIDGSNDKIVPIDLPDPWVIDDISIGSNGLIYFSSFYNEGNDDTGGRIYSINQDGSNMTLLVDYFQSVGMEGFNIYELEVN